MNRERNLEGKSLKQIPAGFESYRKRNMGLIIEKRVEKVNGRDLSYMDFVEKYMHQNQPVILTGLMDDWGACKDWVSPDGTPNLQFFSTHFGNSKVQVADCGTREFSDQKRVEMSVSEFIEKWALHCSSKGDIEEGHGKSLLYLKDWHFVREYPDYPAYTTPLFFCDDWLNLYLDRYRMHSDASTSRPQNEISCSDYRFVYMGPKGTWTPLHADVFRSYSWSANICGKKQWYLLPPSQSHLVFDRHMRNCVYDILEDVDEIKYPGFKKARWWECIQGPNEMIFVPSGWYHQVHNLEDTISINHNWFNAYNISWVWDLLSSDYKEAKDYIEDIKDISDDFEALCQRNLAANTGMNYWDFFIFLARFTLVNIRQLHHLVEGGKGLLCDEKKRVALHLDFNLKSIQSVCRKMKSGGGGGIFRGGHCTAEEEDKSLVGLWVSLEKTYMRIHDDDHHHQHEASNGVIIDDSLPPTPTTSLFDDYNHAGENYSKLFGLVNNNAQQEVCDLEDLIRFIDFWLLYFP